MADGEYIPNTKQLELLRLFYRFRFLTSKHIASILDLDITKVNRRLKILRDNNLIERRYNKQYKIDRRPAEYFIVDDGITTLKRYMPDKCDSRVLHNLYADKKAEPTSIAHYFNVATIYCELQRRYGDDLRFFTKTQIRSYEHFPKQKPEAFIRLDVGRVQKEFFLEVFNPNTPFFSYVGMVKRYIEYSDNRAWHDKTKRKLPKILFVGNTVGTEIRFQKQAARLIRKHYDEEPKVYTTNLEKLKTITPGYDRIWRDVEEPGEIVSLSST